MFKVHENLISFYKENPEKLKERIYIEMVLLENYLKDVNAQHLSIEAFNEWKRMWQLAESYWHFPDIDDMKKMVDKIYASQSK